MTGLKAASSQPTGLACPCTLTWDPSPDLTVTGYGLYYSIAGSSTTNYVDMGMTNQGTLFSLSAGTNYLFYVVAYNAAGLQSAPSNIVGYVPSVLSPLMLAPTASGAVNLEFSAAPGTPCHIEYTPTLSPPQWQTLGSGTADNGGNVTMTDTPSGNSPSRFYRAVTP